MKNNNIFKSLDVEIKELEVQIAKLRLDLAEKERKKRKFCMNSGEAIPWELTETNVQFI